MLESVSMANERQVVAAFKLECVGAEPEQRREPVEVALIVYDDGSRDVGCSYLKKVGQDGNFMISDICKNNKLSDPRSKCVQVSQSNQ